MAEDGKLFYMGTERFGEILDSPDFILQNDFKSSGVLLSRSLLMWENGFESWLLGDFGHKKTYQIRWTEVGPDAERAIEIWEEPSGRDSADTIEDTDEILSHLPSARGTDEGFIDFLRTFNFSKLDLEGLKRADLLGAGFSFESVHQDMLTVQSMLEEILTSPREWLLQLPRGTGENLSKHLQEFYENVRKIQSFQINSGNSIELYDSLVQSISNSCGSVKEPLGHAIAYLSSRKTDELHTKVNATVTTAVDRLNAETDRAEESNNENETRLAETEKKLANKEAEVDQLILKIQNQLTEKPISQYKAIFADQAKEHRSSAWNWLKMAGGATAVFFIVFAGLVWLGSEDSGLTGTLQNFLTKGFVLSPIYVWLNRSIKNYTAQKHLEVINTHRQNALETFDTFVAAAGDNRETRDAVLLAGTEAIFDANQTGYLSTKSSGADSKSPVQQVIREIIPDRSSPKN